jgi:hypothetical protein
MLTPDIVAITASQEIQAGRRVTRVWKLTKLETAGLGRQPSKHKIVPFFANIAYDDVYTFNPLQIN